MYCNNKCKYFNFVNGVSIANNQLVLTFNSAITIADPVWFCFRFSQGLTLPSGYENLPVVASINGDLIPIWNKYGDIMLGKELKLNQVGGLCTRFVYRGYQGSQTSGITTEQHIIVSNAPKLCNCAF